jgi:hypothetical protein
MRRPTLLRALAGAATVALAINCNDFDTTHTPPPRGTIGEEVFGIFCDRVSAQALREDVSGASFRALCHKQRGTYASAVDESKLPPLTLEARDVRGDPVSVANQKRDRDYALARIGALVRRRADLIGAIDAALPNVSVAVKDLRNANEAKSCGAPAASGEAKLGAEVADLLSRFMKLYEDGTMPQSTESLAALMRSISGAPDAQAALARLGSRQGYRPASLGLGAARPALAYPHLRDLANATLATVSADSKPLAPNPRLDSHGRRIPEPGAAYPELTQVLTVLAQELRTKQADAPLPPLVVAREASTGRDLLSRPRGALEAISSVMFAQDAAFGGGSPAYIARRDARGYAQVAKAAGALPAPFVDKDKDGLADVDDLGRFVSSSGTAPAAPFFAQSAPDTQFRDPQGRALIGPGGALMYDYLDTSHSFTASALADLKPLLNRDPNAQHETLMYAIQGAYALLGTRDGARATLRQYPPDAATGGQPVSVAYDAFHADKSPLVDLAYAGAQILGDRSADDTLALSRKLMVNHASEVARTVGAALSFRDAATQHPEATLPAKSTFWDEMIDVAIAMGSEPGLLEDVLRSLSADGAQPLNTIYANYMQYRDHLTYDRANLNGKPRNLDAGSVTEMKTAVDRTKPANGWNRSAWHRFLQMIHDSNGVTVCNKDGARVHAALGGLTVNVPAFGTFKECEAFKIDNIAKFFVDAIAGRATLYLRDSTLRNGILGIGASSVGVMEQSSGITGFWDGPSSKTLRPRPEFLSRQVFFDLAGDSPGSGVNYKTNHFLADLMGPHNVGTVSCPERIIADPSPGAPDAAGDGKVRGLRQCSSGDALDERDADGTFITENFGFIAAMTPLVSAFANHGREDLLLSMMEVLYRHWPDDKALATECGSSGTPQTNPRYCTKDGLVSYEALIAQGLTGDTLPALNALTKVIAAESIARCTSLDPATHACKATQSVDGITASAETVRALIDPARAKAAGLTDRAGIVTSLRNDGKTNPQTTPIYLLTAGLSGVDQAFADYAPKGPSDDGRQAAWRRARSQLVDQFLGVKGSGATSTFAEPAIPKIAPVLIDMLRAQLLSHCADAFTPPYKSCAWMRSEVTRDLADKINGPLFSASFDLGDAVRRDDAARTELEGLLSYLVDTASQNDALPALLATSSDALQFLRDDQNLVPFFHALAPALAPSTRNAEGQFVSKSLTDANLALLARISGKYVDASGTEICAREVDPNQILTQVLTRLVTPMEDPSGRAIQAPIEVIVDVIGDVSRRAPEQTGRLSADDYKSVADDVTSFLADEQSGLEQFYEVVRRGTSGQ